MMENGALRTINVTEMELVLEVLHLVTNLASIIVKNPFDNVIPHEEQLAMMVSTVTD